ncbi:PTS mannose/fructose/sorbose transporter subunit IIB [candidate division KSB1 bacterium]|nr:MAG: PTS mannose/fructose/sorbose transporter subunit IIB [candidate division KSB1 bacterium]
MHLDMKLPFFRGKDKIVFPIVRVDDRLLHGQVIVGWGQTLGLHPVLLVSDRIGKDSELAATFRQLVPEELRGDIVTVAEAAELWTRGDFKDARPLLVVETPVDALKMVRLGAPMKVLTIGGLHFREGRDEILPYVFLSDWDRTTLRELAGLGVRIQCQDLPASKPILYED